MAAATKTSSRASRPPRRLSENEIEAVLDGLREPPGLLPKQRRYALERIKDVQRSMLRRVRITPDGLEQLKRELTESYHRAEIQPGSATGIWSAESQGQIIQQATLDVFHQTGSASAGGSGSEIDMIKQVLFVSRNGKNLSMDIHFNAERTRAASSRCQTTTASSGTVATSSGSHLRRFWSGTRSSTTRHCSRTAIRGGMSSSPRLMAYRYPAPIRRMTASANACFGCTCRHGS